MLEKLAGNSQKAINDGIYEIEGRIPKSGRSIIDDMRNNPHAPLITEIKFSSPSLGEIRKKSDPVAIAKMMVDGGTSGLSVLTQPHLFNGSPQYFTEIRRSVSVPMLMKDIVIDKVQVDAAERIGADIVLLIQSIFDRKLARDVDEFVGYAHKKGLLVLAESHTKAEFIAAAKTGADILGINNRNLDTLDIDLGTTESILSGYRGDGRPVISESGIETPEHIRYLHRAGANAFLVGSSIMKSKDIKGLVSSLVLAI